MKLKPKIAVHQRQPKGIEQRVDFAALEKLYALDAMDADAKVRAALRTARDELLKQVEMAGADNRISPLFVASLKVETGTVGKILQEYLVGVWRKARDLAMREMPGKIKEKLEPLKTYSDEQIDSVFYLTYVCAYCNERRYHLPGKHDQCDHSPTGTCVDPTWKKKEISDKLEVPFLSSKEKFVVDFYQSGEGFSDINGYLREGPIGYAPERIQKAVIALDKIIKTKGVTLSTDIVFYRGVDLADLPGKSFQEKGYLSATVNQDSAAFFGDTVLAINVKAGAKVLPIMSGSEKEVLLPRGLKLTLGSEKDTIEVKDRKIKVITSTVENYELSTAWHTYAIGYICVYCNERRYHLPGEHDQCDHSPTGTCVDPEWEKKKDISIGDIQKNGIPSGFLIRGVRQGNLVLGQGEKGVWATDNLDHALSFGDKIELVKIPDKIYKGDPVSLANFFKSKGNEINDVSELTKTDWLKMQKYLASKGYGGADFGPMHTDKANDYWIFDIKKLEDETKVHAYATGFSPQLALDYFASRALILKGIIDQTLLNQAKLRLMEYLKGGETLNEMIGNLRSVFEPWVGDPTKIQPSGQVGIGFPPGEKAPENILMAYRLENIIRTETTTAMSQGRAAVGDAAGDYVIGYTLSAILDDRVTVICETADGLTFRKNDENATKLLPPLHFQCRTVPIFVTTDDVPIKWSTPAEIDKVVRLIPEGFK